jgi:hypothetical protein
MSDTHKAWEERIDKMLTNVIAETRVYTAMKLNGEISANTMLDYGSVSRVAAKQAINAAVLELVIGEDDPNIHDDLAILNQNHLREFQRQTITGKDNPQ